MQKLVLSVLLMIFTANVWSQSYESMFVVDSSEQTEVAHEFQVFVWNLYMFKYVDATKLKEHGLDQVIYSSDFLLFQEILVDKNHLQDHLNIDLFNLFQVPYLKRRKGKYRPNDIWNGFGTASLVEANNNEVVISRSVDLADGTKSMAIISEYPIKDKEQKLMIIHVHNGVSVFRTMQLMKRLKAKILNHDGPLIVAGDFNSFLFKKYFVKRWAKKLGLKDSNVETPFIFKQIKLGQLDHAFYRGLELTKDVVVLEATKHLSDHQGYVLNFKIP